MDVNTRIKCGKSLKPTAKHISDTCFWEVLSSSQAVSNRYCVTNCEKVMPLLRLKKVQNAERFMPIWAAMSSRSFIRKSECGPFCRRLRQEFFCRVVPIDGSRGWVFVTAFERPLKSV